MVESADVPTVNSLLRIQTCVRDWESNLFLKSWQQTESYRRSKKEVKNKAIEEHHTILFICGANKNKYCKLIEEMKNDILKALSKIGRQSLLTSIDSQVECVWQIISFLVCFWWTCLGRHTERFIAFLHENPKPWKAIVSLWLSKINTVLFECF